MQKTITNQKTHIVAMLAAAAFSAPALAETGNVSVYGKVNVDFESVSNDKVATAATTMGQERIQSNASRFGVKGSAVLGDGLAAVWQLEVQVDPANGGATPFNGTRNSHVGLKGDFGTVSMGTWDTPYKLAHNKLELFDNATIFTATSMVGRTGHTNTASATSAAHNVNFNTRQSSVVQYWTPVMSGLQGMIAYSPDVSETATANRKRVSLSGTYENDMLYAALAYENRGDHYTVGMNDSAVRVVGAYKFGDGQVGAMYEHLRAGTAVATEETQYNWELAASYKFDKSTLGAFYANNSNLGTRANTSANMYSLRYGYNYDKRTELYGAYTRLQNDASANYSTLGTTAGTIGALAAGTLGTTQTGFGVGIIHSF